MDTPKNDKGNDTLLNDIKETEDKETKDNEGSMSTQEYNGGTESEEVNAD